MAYKKYIKRNGKTFGPYYYESYRDSSGIVRKRYIGLINPNEKKLVTPTNRYINIIFIFGFLFIFLSGIIFLGLSINSIFSNSTIEKQSLDDINKKTLNGNEQIAEFFKPITNSVLKIVGFVTEISTDNSNSDTSNTESETDSDIIQSDDSGNLQTTNDDIKIDIPIDDNPDDVITNPEVEDIDKIDEENENQNDNEQIELDSNETKKDESISNETESNNTKLNNLNKTEVIDNVINNTISNESITELNRTQINETIIELNITESNITGINETLANITYINTTENNISIQTIQYGAVIGKPVRWKKTVVSDIETNLTIEIPFEAENVTVFKIINNESEEINENEDRIEIDEDSFSITGEVVLGEGEFVLWEWIKKLFSSLTGRTIDVQEKTAHKNIVIDENATDFEIEYETQAPQSIEKNISFGKEIIISGPDELHYENVLAYTELDEEQNSGRVKLYWIQNDTKTNVFIDEFDTNNNGLVDYIEWVVPSLSNQTYQLIIEISKAEHLDYNRTFISDIYEEVKALDGNWSETINDGEFVRITFEQNLTSERDITLYPQYVNSTNETKIEVYEVYGNETIAIFENFNENEYNKIYLTNLNGMQDVFDLKVVGGSLKFEHIIDPADIINPNINFTYPTPPNATTQSSTSFYVNVSTSDSSNHSAFINWNNSLVLWMKMDEYNSSTVFDNSTYGNNGTINGNATINTSGVRGSSFSFDGEGDFINASTTDLSLSDTDRLTLALWVDYIGAYDGSDHTLVSRGTTVYPFSFEIQTSIAQEEISPSCKIRTDGSTTLNHDFNDNLKANVWYHFACVYNGSDIIIYVNGVEASKSTKTGELSEVVGEINIGQKSGGVNLFNGSFDEVLIWNRDLSPDEITALYNATSKTGLAKNFTGLTNGNYTYRGHVIDEAGNTNMTELRSVSIVSDNEYPLFYNFWDDNSTLINSGIAHFNVSINSTNATVYLEFNGTNFTASNLTATLFNASVNVVGNGTYSYYWGSWGNGTDKNYNTSALRDYVVNAAAGSITPSGGGGGGGSSTTTSSKNFSIDKTKTSIKLKQGETKEISLTITNPTKSKINFEVSSDLEKLMKITDPKFILNPGKSKEIIVDIIAKENQKPDLYLGHIKLNGGGEEREVIVSIEITSKSSLFDVILKISDDTQKIMPGNNLNAEISLIKIINNEKEDVEITYEIRDLENNTILKLSDTRAVETTINYIKEIQIPSDLTEGDYILYIGVDSEGKIASASSFFRVVQEENNLFFSPIIKLLETNKIIIMYIIGSLIIICIFYYILSKFIYTPKKRTKNNNSKHKKYVVKKNIIKNIILI